MQNKKYKRQWFDGRFYSLFLEPPMNGIYRNIASFVRSGSSVIDAGCGPGAFLKIVSEKARKIYGIDISPANIDQAKDKLSGLDAELFCGDAGEIITDRNLKADYAVSSLALHEMPPEIREQVAESMAKAADMIIIADYAAPLPKNLMSPITIAIEFFAGKEHFRNFRDFSLKGGIDNILKKIGFARKSTLYSHHKNIEIVLAEKV